MQPEQADRQSDWLTDNVLAPLVNGAILEPYNAAANLGNTVATVAFLPEVEIMDVPQAGGIAASMAQTVSHGIGSLVPFVIAGKLTHGALGKAGALIDATPQLKMLQADGMTARVLANESIANLLGAGAYAGAMDPADGQTRLGNALGMMAGFAAFERGNRLSAGMKFLPALSTRILSGAGGGLSQYEISNFVSNGSLGTFGGLSDALLSGAAMNSLLPVAQHGAQRFVDRAEGSSALLGKVNIGNARA
ncbi:MAG TPA: hypothetical protein V6C72_19475 [Chroococcales cyanobacterium]